VGVAVKETQNHASKRIAGNLKNHDRNKENRGEKWVSSRKAEKGLRYGERGGKKSLILGSTAEGWTPCPRNPGRHAVKPFLDERPP